MEKCDFLVIGSGLAGLAFALEAAKHGNVIVLTKATITDSNTNWAQGGIAAAVGESDSWQLHEQDTLVAGAGLCDQEAVRFLVQNAPAAIHWLQENGAQFDLSGSNELDLGKEGGHSRHRIIHHADKTGWEVERTVSAAVKRNSKIRVFENAFVTKLLLHNERCVGATVQIAEAGLKTFVAKATMLATGGCGKVYATTTNPRVATGDGLALAYEIGAKIQNLEFMQFHPTTLSHQQSPGFLLTEALRGAGATLRNHQGRRFMYDYDPRLELAPRDVVARAIQREIQTLDTWCVYLDSTHLPQELLKTEFPTIYQKLRELSIEIDKEWVPVVPAQHYSCGGVVTNFLGQTNIPGLYASGEVTCTGVHGANRLASNSLLEAIVFSISAATAVPDEPDFNVTESDLDLSQPPCMAENDAIHFRQIIQRSMSRNLGIFRTNRGLKDMNRQLQKLEQEIAELPRAPFSPYSQEGKNLFQVASLVTQAAIARTENIGLHFNADHSE